MQPTFQIAGGSVTGKDHRKGVPRNRQDAWHVEHGPRAVTALVSDGCGSGEASEVGAALAVRLTTTYLHRYLNRGFRPNEEMLERVRRDVLSQLHVLARDIGESLSEVVNHYFLFTLAGVIITDEVSTFFALGDGVMFINGELIVLQPEAGNQPIYLGYALTGSALTDDNPASLHLRIVRQVTTANLSHFLVGTDGVADAHARATRFLPGTDEPFGDISQFWENDRFFNSPVAITRRLNLMARDWTRRLPEGRQVIEGGLLPDDTTFVVGRLTPDTKEE